MKAIILAAGKGTRLQPLTLEVPKAMVEVHGKSLLQYNMEALLPYVDEFIIIVKYKKELIIDYFGDEFKGIPIRYYEQGNKSGTGGALEGLQISGDCYIIASDTIYRQSDIDLIANTSGYGALCQQVNNPEKYGIFKTAETGNITQVIEKPQEYISNLASLFYLKVNSDLIDFCEDINVSPRGEYELTDALNIFVDKYPVAAIQIHQDFIDITSLEDLEKANTLHKPNLGETQYLENIGEYELHLGIPETGIQEIVNYSLDKTDTALRSGTSDWKKRFISVENLTAWYNDTDRYPFTLLSKDGIVGGLWWGRPALSPQISEVLNSEAHDILLKNSTKTHTSGIRIYPFARGEGLAKPFLKACTRYYDSLFSEVHMCIDIDAQNTPSIKSFEKMGFQQVGYGKNVNNSPDSGKLRLVYIRVPK